MAPQEYYAFLVERNKQIHQDCEILFLECPTMLKKDVFERVAAKYSLSAGRVTSIYYDVARGILPRFRSDLHEPTPSQRDAYYAVLGEREKDPGHSNYEYIRRVAAQRNLLFRTVENYFYQYRKLLRQQEQAAEQGPAQEPVDGVA